MGRGGGGGGGGGGAASQWRRTTAAMAAPLFTAEINNSLVINYNCNRNVFDLRQLLLALLFKQDGCEF